MNKGDSLVLHIWARSNQPGLFQPVMAIEEMSELQKELTKLIRGSGKMDKIKEEIADVELCLYSIKYGFGIEENDLDKIKNEKIGRYFERVEKGIYG